MENQTKNNYKSFASAVIKAVDDAIADRTNTLVYTRDILRRAHLLIGKYDSHSRHPIVRKEFQKREREGILVFYTIDIYDIVGRQSRSLRVNNVGHH